MKLVNQIKLQLYIKFMLDVATLCKSLLFPLDNTPDKNWLYFAIKLIFYDFDSGIYSNVAKLITFIQI